MSMSMSSSQVSDPLPSDAASSESPLDNNVTVSVKCGSATGVLYVDKLNASGSKVAQKCILSDSAWYTPAEFEGLGGKGKSKNWKKSIYREGSCTPLGTYLASIGSVCARSCSASPIQRRSRGSCSNSFLSDPILAFIKAYRLKGDLVGLKQEVCSQFDPSSLGSAHKLLWDFCGSDLEQLGLPFHARRGSDKRQVTDIFVADIVTALDKLDSVEKIPDIYCEATDLIKLPSLNLDPVSKKLVENGTTLQSLVEGVKALPSKVSAVLTESVTKCCVHLEKLVSSVKEELDQFSRTVSSGTYKPKLPQTSSGAAVEHSSANTGQSQQSRVVDGRPTARHDRSNNVILFGLPESSLLDTKSAIDDLSTFLIGKTIKVVDAFRLGRRSELNNTRPRPLLIKVDNFWDRRLLLSSCRKLKGYSVSKLFLREDLPPEARTSKRKVQNKKASEEGVLVPTDTERVDSSKQPPSDPTSGKQSFVALTTGINSGDSVHHDQ